MSWLRNVDSEGLIICKDEEEKHDKHDTFIHNIEDIHSSFSRISQIASHYQKKKKKKSKYLATKLHFYHLFQVMFVLTYYDDGAYSQKTATWHKTTGPTMNTVNFW